MSFGDPGDELASPATASRSDASVLDFFAKWYSDGWKILEFEIEPAVSAAAFSVGLLCRRGRFSCSEVIGGEDSRKRSRHLVIHRYLNNNPND